MGWRFLISEVPLNSAHLPAIERILYTYDSQGQILALAFRALRPPPKSRLGAAGTSISKGLVRFRLRDFEGAKSRPLLMEDMTPLRERAVAVTLTYLHRFCTGENPDPG